MARLGFFAALTLVHTWPLAMAPGTFSRVDNADAQLNAWILAWVAHALPHDPLHLFQANVFFPARDTLAFSEHLFVPALFSAPALWLGANPILGFNIGLVAGLTLTGWATCHVMTRWTGDAWAGLFAGSVVAFNTHLFTRMAHVQAMHVEFLPLALLALDDVLRRARTRDALLLGWWFALQALCSGYLFALSAVAMATTAVARPEDWWGRRFRLVVPKALLAAALSAVLLLPFLIPYARVRQEQGLTRSIEEVALYSAHPRDYLTTVSRVHFDWWSHRFYTGNDAFFPGVAAVLLAAVALLSRRAWRESRTRTLVAIGGAGFILSLGPAVPFYTWLHNHVPLFQGLRGAARFGFLVVVAVAGLAAFGLASLRAHVAQLGRPRLALALAVACVALANVENLVAPVEYTRFRGIPLADRVLADVPGAIVAELPFPPIGAIGRQAPAMLASTAHWRPIVNGYSGFVPPGFADTTTRLEAFPSTGALDELRRLGVTHVVVSLEEAPELSDLLAAMPQFVTVASGRARRVYRLRW